MRGPRATLGAITAAVIALGLGAAAAPAVGAARLAAGEPAAARPAAGQPAVTLVAAQPSVTLTSSGPVTFLDPGLFVVPHGAPLQFDVRRSSLTAPIRLSRIIHGPGGSVTEIPLPARLADQFRGLRDFAVITVRNSAGRLVASRPQTFCPDVFDPQRTSQETPRNTPFPQTQCGSMPFEKSMVWGIQRGWGADLMEFSNGFRLAPGTYQVTATISAPYRSLLRLPLASSTATVSVRIVPGHAGFQVPRRRSTGRALPRLPRAGLMASPPAAALPDLVPLPSWGVQMTVKPGRHGHPAADHLNFNSTVAIDGHSPLDVEGFRPAGSQVMNAFQYFFRHGKVIGRAPAGTMTFDSDPGQQGWKFQQFAQYRLLDASKTNVLLSHKEAFCIEATDPYDLLHRGALWQIPFGGFFTLGATCGDNTALWIREQLQVGWSDTYAQTIRGENFDVTGLPNGTYYIEIIANPEKVLHETDMANDVSLRKVILGGTPGHRTVRVPPFAG